MERPYPPGTLVAWRKPTTPQECAEVYVVREDNGSNALRVTLVDARVLRLPLVPVNTFRADEMEPVGLGA